MMYRPSNRLCKAVQIKKVKGKPTEVTLGVAECEPHVVGEGFDQITFVRLWVGWIRMGQLVDDQYLIDTYGWYTPPQGCLSL